MSRDNPSETTTCLQGKHAIVIGGSSGLGKATVKALSSEGAKVIAVGRNREKLGALEAEAPERLSCVQGDATDQAFIEQLFRESKPDLVVLTAGVTPSMGRIDELDWESFSEPWNIDVKAAFLIVRQSLTQPLSPGSAVVLVSSGAAIDGSPLSGGYAGAKRMQSFLANYAQSVADVKKLGIRFIAVLPRPIEGTTIGANAAAAYSRVSGTTQEAFMKGVGVSVNLVASAILTSLHGGVPVGVTAIAVTSNGVKPLT